MRAFSFLPSELGDARTQLTSAILLSNMALSKEVYIESESQQISEQEEPFEQKTQPDKKAVCAVAYRAFLSTVCERTPFSKCRQRFLSGLWCAIGLR